MSAWATTPDFFYFHTLPQYKIPTAISVFLIQATSMMYVGLTMTSAAQFQMLRGPFEIYFPWYCLCVKIFGIFFFCHQQQSMFLIKGSIMIFVGLLSVIFLKKKLEWFRWTGMAVVVVGSLDIIIIIITRPKPAYGRQGLAGSWGQDTDEVSTFLVFLTSHFAPAALSSDLTNLGPLMTMKIHLETLKNHGNQPTTMKPWKPTKNHEKHWNHLEKRWKPTKNRE